MAAPWNGIVGDIPVHVGDRVTTTTTLTTVDKPGGLEVQFIRARLIWGTQNAPVVPVLAVSRIGGQYFAFVAEPGTKSGSYVAHQKPLSA